MLRVQQTLLICQSANREEMAAWITWKAADNAWHEARIYRATRITMWAAVIAAVAAIVAVVEGWSWPLWRRLPGTH